jgi:hypothetical protein
MKLPRPTTGPPIQPFPPGWAGRESPCLQRKQLTRSVRDHIADDVQVFDVSFRLGDRSVSAAGIERAALGWLPMLQVRRLVPPLHS